MKILGKVRIAADEMKRTDSGREAYRSLGGMMIKSRWVASRDEGSRPGFLSSGGHSA
jgi:hypothetical protein